MFMAGKLILIGGVSRSGKSTLAQQLASVLPHSAYLEQDFFVKSEEQLPVIQNRIDWDSPESVDWISWEAAIRNNLESYDWVVAEGIFAFYNEVINELKHFTIHLSVDRNTFLDERKKETRWGEEPEWFLDHVWESHLKYSNVHNIDFDLSANRAQLPPVSLIKEQVLIK